MSTQQDAVYLFKSARRESYRRENLHLLAAERGSVVEVAHNNMWVAPEYLDHASLPRGMPVYFVLTERPFSMFVPIRQGEIVDVRRDDLAVRMRIVLRSWVALEDREVTDFTEVIKKTSRGNAPGNKFLVPKRDDIALEPRYDEREEEGWSQAIDNVLAMSRASQLDPYADSVFFRPVGLLANGELHPARRVPLAVGARASLLLRFYNPHLSEERARDFSLRAWPVDEALKVEGPTTFPPVGDVELGLEVLGEAPELLVNIGPAPAQHTSITARFLTPEQASAAEAGPASESVRDELVHLYDSIYRNVQFRSAENELEFLSAYERLIPDESRLLERKGLLLSSRGRDEDAFQVLRKLNPEMLGDEARFALFHMWLHRDAKPARHVSSLDLLAIGRFDRLLDELDKFDSGTLARFLPELVSDLPIDFLWRAIDRAGRRLESPEAINETAVGLFAASDDATAAFRYLMDRRQALRLNHPAVVETLFWLAARGAEAEFDPELAKDGARHIGILIGRGDIEAARSKLREMSKGIGREQRDRLHHQIADRLANDNHFEQAADVMGELAYASCGTGDLTTATDAIERAEGLLARTGARPAWLADITEAVHRAWEAFEPLAEWRRTDEQRRRDTIRKKLLNETILIVGGFRVPEWNEPLRDFTGAAIEWAEHYRNEGADLNSIAGRIASGRYKVVVYRLQKSGHEVQYKLKGECEKVGVPFVATTTAGRRGVEEAVYNAAVSLV